MTGHFVLKSKLRANVFSKKKKNIVLLFSLYLDFEWIFPFFFLFIEKKEWNYKS